ncbi:MAG: preprotein translocase subunit SecE [Clostridia bacterium]|nr:preprotein translocase subunit SecE [Clostridia bacterium]MBQ3869166.1 preprotein translocase subunit SecE [Clostridia bacterium]
MANEPKASVKTEVQDSQKAKKPGFFSRIGGFLKSCKGELKKITWPTPKQTAKNTGIVLATMAVIGVIVVLLDLLFSQLIGLLTKI